MLKLQASAIENDEKNATEICYRQTRRHTHTGVKQYTSLFLERRYNNESGGKRQRSIEKKCRHETPRYVHLMSGDRQGLLFSCSFMAEWGLQFKTGHNVCFFFKLRGVVGIIGMDTNRTKKKVLDRKKIKIRLEKKIKIMMISCIQFDRAQVIALSCTH